MGGKFRHGLLQKSLKDEVFVVFSIPGPSGKDDVLETDTLRKNLSGPHKNAPARARPVRPATVFLRTEELKKAVAVSEEKIQQRSRRRGQFSSSRFPCRKVPKPWQG